MSFQSTVFLQQGFGVPGELFANSPRNGQSYIINSASAAYNIFGYGFSITSQGNAAAGNSGGTAVFAGILSNPKGSALDGVGGNPLAPTLTLPNYAQGELLTQGSIVVYLPAAAAIGDFVLYDQTDGHLTTVAPGTSLPGGKSWAYATVDYFTVTAAGLAVITLKPSLAVPA